MIGSRGAPAGLVITIDGPAGSGKSTTAREVAKRLGLRHLDSGALYRGLTLAATRRGVSEGELARLDRDAVAELEVDLSATPEGFRVHVNGEDPGSELRSPEVTRLAPRLATNPWVREKLGQLQRSALRFGGLVADGRDMGTVVFPEAPLKVFLTASLEERSRRRLVQDGRDTDAAALDQEAMRIQARDEADTRRKLAPLTRPRGALEINTTALPFKLQVDRIVDAASGLTAKLAEE